ncbi:MAG: phosphatase PAP2 family protein [Clostridia bacterium]|nr:phosphatase PAP2 family protein [Clostridia bacterium]
MNYINNLDDKIYNLLITMQSQGIKGIMIFISYLASALTLIILSIAFIFLIKNKKYSKLIALNLALSFITNRILKFIIRRPRPERIQILTERGYSFPSGHAMVGFAYYGFLIYLVSKNIKNKKIKYPLMIFLSLLILFVGISRVYVGVHYVTDILGGYIFGFFYLVLFIKYVYKNEKIKI